MIEFRFAHPWALLLLLLPLLFWFRSRRDMGKRFAPVLNYSDTRLIAGLPVGWRVRLRRLPDLVRLLAWVVLLIALARPQSGRARELIRGQGIDIVLALDISNSMSSPDFQPDNRLEAAKNVLAEFIRNREFDRIGLVVFARDAFIHVPLTLDYDVLLGLIDEVRLAPQLGLLDGTAIGMGLASAGNMVRGTDTLSKVVVLLTDGANNAGAIDPITAADALSALGIKVYTVGMGKPEAAASIEGSELDEGTLQTIAALTDGFFFRAESTSSLQLVYEQIDGLERSPVERQLFVRWQDQVVGWLTAALLLLVGERIMRHTVFQTIP